MSDHLPSPAPGNTAVSKDRPIPIPVGAPYITVLGSYIGHAQQIELAMRCRRCTVEIEGTAAEVHERLRAHHDVAHPQPKPALAATPTSTAAPKPAAPKPVGVKAAPAPKAAPKPKPKPAPKVKAVPAPKPPPEPRECRNPDCHVDVSQLGARPDSRVWCSPACKRRVEYTSEVSGKAGRTLRVPCTRLVTQGKRTGQPCGRASHGGVCRGHLRVEANAARPTPSRRGPKPQARTLASVPPATPTPVALTPVPVMPTPQLPWVYARDLTVVIAGWVATYPTVAAYPEVNHLLDMLRAQWTGARS